MTVTNVAILSTKLSISNFHLDSYLIVGSIV